MFEGLVEALGQTGVFRVSNAVAIAGGVCIRGQVSRDPEAARVWGGIIRNLLVRSRKDLIKDVDVSRAYDLKTVVFQFPSGPKREERLVCAWRLILPERAIPYLMGECRRVLETQKRAAAMRKGDIPLGPTAVSGGLTLPSKLR